MFYLGHGCYCDSDDPVSRMMLFQEHTTMEDIHLLAAVKNAGPLGGFIR